MERVTNHERPGVYSAYTATAAAQRGNRRGVAAVVAVSQKGTAGTLYALGSYRQAAEAFGAEDGLTALVKLLLANGAARVLAVPVADENGYEAAFALVQEQEGVNVVICDSEKLAVQQKLRDSVMSASAERRERIAVVAGAAGETAEALVKRAGELNSERVVLVAPAVSQEAGGTWVAAAVAGAICGGSDPALPLGGAELQGISALEKRLDESEVDALIRGGVTPVERVGGSCWVIRGVTTRTKTGQASDQTWRDLTTILVVDDVIPGVREALRARFPRAKNTAQTRGAVQSLVVEVLERKLAVVQGYTAQTTRSSTTVEAFGEKEPVATIPGQSKHVLELTRMYATDEALADGINFYDLEDFSLVICKPDRRVIYSGCQWSKIGETGALGASVVEKVTVVAGRRIETA